MKTILKFFVEAVNRFDSVQQYQYECNDRLDALRRVLSFQESEYDVHVVMEINVGNESVSIYLDRNLHVISGPTKCCSEEWESEWKDSIGFVNGGFVGAEM